MRNYAEVCIYIALIIIFCQGMSDHDLNIGLVPRPDINGSGAVGGATLEDVDCEGDSISSSGSFHSTLESLEDTHVS